jgi:hypothetical protein
MGLQRHSGVEDGPKQANGGTPWYSKPEYKASHPIGPVQLLVLVRDCPILDPIPPVNGYPAVKVSPRTVYARRNRRLGCNCYGLLAWCRYKRQTIRGHLLLDHNGEYVFRAFTGQGRKFQ